MHFHHLLLSGAALVFLFLLFVKIDNLEIEKPMDNPYVAQMNASTYNVAVDSILYDLESLLHIVNRSTLEATVTAMLRELKPPVGGERKAKAANSTAMDSLYLGRDSRTCFHSNSKHTLTRNDHNGTNVVAKGTGLGLAFVATTLLAMAAAVALGLWSRPMDVKLEDHKKKPKEVKVDAAKIFRHGLFDSPILLLQVKVKVNGKTVAHDSLQPVQIHLNGNPTVLDDLLNIQRVPVKFGDKATAHGHSPPVRPVQVKVNEKSAGPVNQAAMANGQFKPNGSSAATAEASAAPPVHVKLNDKSVAHEGLAVSTAHVKLDNKATAAADTSTTQPKTSGTLEVAKKNAPAHSTAKKAISLQLC